MKTQTYLNNTNTCFIPCGLDVTIAKTSLNKEKEFVYTIYIHSLGRAFFFNCNGVNICFDDQLRMFEFETRKFNSNEKSLKNVIEQLVFSLENYFIKKLKFAGKSFRIEKKAYKNFKSSAKNIYNYKFGHSYQTWLYLVSSKQKHFKKTKFFILTTNLTKLNKNILQILALRDWNMYTQRGIRLYKQQVVKKPGKKSSFT